MGQRLRRGVIFIVLGYRAREEVWAVGRVGKLMEVREQVGVGCQAYSIFSRPGEIGTNYVPIV